MSSDDRWISTVLKSGTTSDRVAAMTIRVNCARCEIAELEAAVVAIGEAVHALLRDP